MVGSAKQSGSVNSGLLVTAYDENGRTLFTVNGKLLGFTGSTVTVESCGTVRTLDDRGRTLYSMNS